MRYILQVSDNNFAIYHPCATMWLSLNSCHSSQQKVGKPKPSLGWQPQPFVVAFLLGIRFFLLNPFWKPITGFCFFFFFFFFFFFRLSSWNIGRGRRQKGFGFILTPGIAAPSSINNTNSIIDSRKDFEIPSIRIGWARHPTIEH